MGLVQTSTADSLTKPSGLPDLGLSWHVGSLALDQPMIDLGILSLNREGVQTFDFNPEDECRIIQQTLLTWKVSFIPCKQLPAKSCIMVLFQSRPKDSTSSLASGTNKKKGKGKAVYFWTNDDVNKWLRKHCMQYFQIYSSVFKEHDITGTSILHNNQSIDVIRLWAQNLRVLCCKILSQNNYIEVKEIGYT